MTLFTTKDCKRCKDLQQKFDLQAMEVQVEVLDAHNAEALAHLAWHSLVESARKSMPLLVLDDSSTIEEFMHIEEQLAMRANQYGLLTRQDPKQPDCDGDSCTFH